MVNCDKSSMDLPRMIILWVAGGHWQAYFQTQWPYTSHDLTWPHELLLPTEGGVRLGPKGHVLKGQIGGISNEPVHEGCI
jgi:hypothetical protein